MLAAIGNSIATLETLTNKSSPPTGKFFKIIIYEYVYSNEVAQNSNYLEKYSGIKKIIFSLMDILIRTMLFRF